MIVSPSVSLMAAGVASAICILIFSNMIKGKSGSSKREEGHIPLDESRCSCCLRPFLLGRGVLCNDCGARSCRKGCSRWDTSDNAWHCLFCHQQRYWLKKNGLQGYGGSINEDLQRYFNTARSQVYLTGVENAATSSGSCLAVEKKEASTMETIRDVVEKIVEGLIGNAEDTPVDRLYDHPAYNKLSAKYIVPLVNALIRLVTALELSLKNKPSPDSPRMAHTALREIVERAVDEARKLPSLGGSGEPGRPPEVGEHSYEDLLATAILNKVIEKFQKEQVDGNSNVLHGKPVPAGNCASSERGLDEGVEGCLEPSSRDNCTRDCNVACFKHSRNQLDPTVSLMIEERIEEVTTTYGSDEESKENDVAPIRNAHRVPFPELGMDIIDPSQESSEDSQDEPDTPTTHIGLVSPVESWEENWLFQKKRVQSQADPVAMLVPNPSADFKALIGDKDAEDTSDLSECSSAQSDEEIEKELMEAINNVVPRSPKRTCFENGDYDSGTSIDNSMEDPEEMQERRSNGAKEEVQRGKIKEIDARTNGEVEESIEEVVKEPLIVPLREESPLEVPKTPTSTPTWTFVPETSVENVGDQETGSRERNVLNSLECAKKKLMAVNDDTEVKEEDCGQQKHEFPAEDIQQESEYTEHYDTAIQRRLDSLSKLETLEQLEDSSKEDAEDKCREAAALAKAESASHSSLKKKKAEDEEEVRLATPPRPGTIAEREHKKWENAPPIQNNPYSEENIQKRLLERQYSRRSSDIPGIHTELPKSNGADLDVVLAPHEPDIKRFGRDYYINHSRAPSNEKGRRSAASTSSRPGSSLSQGSSSTGPDQDQQDETRYRETEALLNRSNDVKSKVAKWQNNNRCDGPEDALKASEKVAKRIEHRLRTWEDERMEEILENERKNNKNEVNAKLNNQETTPVIETRKSDEKPRRIKRIDLKAYGFANEFFSSGDKAIRAPRVVNKLDLSSFGYDGGIRRTQSNIQLNSIGSEDLKARMRSTKSNLTRHYGNDAIGNRASGDNNLTQSNEALNKFHGEACFGLKSAKSVPNIAKFYSNRDDEEVEAYSRSSYDLGIAKNGSVRNIANNYNLEKRDRRNDEWSVDESDDTDNSSERGQQRSRRVWNLEDLESKALPSVRRLAEAFSKQSENGPVPKANKASNAYKERSSTPEIQIVESPRQMHSLTARSLSKQFREGLRQIPNKVTTPPASHVAMEQPRLLENQPEVVQARSDASNDVNVILPGKLKSNIIFWEQMQRRS